MAESSPRFEGELVELGGKEFVVPALSLRQIRELAPKLDQLDSDAAGLPSVDQISIVVDVLHAALSRNYPELTKEDLVDLIDLGNMSALIKAAMRTSGLEKKVRPGAAASP
jgi:hypothetical protein